jgi:single-strand DNA-binding protein
MNIITIAGALGKDAELRTTPKGDHVASFSVADNQGKDKPPIWWRCQLWGKRAETLTQYLTKGQSVTVTGQVSVSEYKDKDGTPKQSYDVRVVDVALQGGQRHSEAPARFEPPRQATKPANTSYGFDDMEDSEIPF